MPTKLSHEVLSAAIEGFETQKARIDAQIAELRAMLSGGPTEPAVKPVPKKGRRWKLSAAGRRAISEATKKRWAALKAAKAAEKPAAAKKAAPKKAVVKTPVKATKQTAAKKPRKKAAKTPAAVAPAAG